jgi:aspartyl-tRNA(Asn)/glutamyl-tRNA(Gln) amidotransferase subunit A
VSAGFTKGGLPLSVQVVGHPFGEAAAYRAGQAVEDALGERARRPALAHLAEAA